MTVLNGCLGWSIAVATVADVLYLGNKMADLTLRTTSLAELSILVVDEPPENN